MRRKLTVIVPAAGLAFASAALAASPPTAGGTYKGTDDSKSSFPTNRSVTLVVSHSRANFAKGRINFVLHGQGGLGSCAGQAYATLGPTRVRQISRQGTFDLHGQFKFVVPTPYGPATYKATVTIKGGFGNAGKKVTGTLQETATGRALTCRSGTVHFTAALVK